MIGSSMIVFPVQEKKKRITFNIIRSTKGLSTMMDELKKKDHSN